MTTDLLLTPDLCTFAQHVSAMLSSPYKPILLLLTFFPWAWIVSTVIDKDTKYFHLNVNLWSGINLGCGAAALAAALFIPIFWIAWPVAILILAGNLFAYMQHRNSKVGDAHKYRLGGEGVGAALDKRKKARAARQSILTFRNKDGKTFQPPTRDEPSFDVHLAAEDLLSPAIEARASSVEFVVSKGGSSVSQTIDGIRYKREPLSAELASQLVNHFKQIIGLDTTEQRKRQQASFRVEGPGGRTELVCITQGSQQGVMMKFDIDRAKRLSKPFDALGLLPVQREGLASIMEPHDRHGIVLVGAPAGHGLTTTMYSLIGRHDAYTSNIKMLERENELILDGVDHVIWDPSNPDVDYATNLQSMLRRDPDIVGLALIRDPETAKIASDPGMQGPLLYIPQRCGSIIEQLQEFSQQVGDVKKATRAIRAVMNQRLLRTLCAACKQPFAPTPEQLKKLNIPAGKVSQLFRANGKVQIKNKIEPCPVCRGMGYMGQVGIFEVMPVDADMRKLLAAGDFKGARDAARRNKMIYLQESALAKVASGETSIEEVLRVTAPPKAAPEAAAAGAS